MRNSADVADASIAMGATSEATARSVNRVRAKCFTSKAAMRRGFTAIRIGASTAVEELEWSRGALIASAPLLLTSSAAPNEKVTS